MACQIHAIYPVNRISLLYAIAIIVILQINEKIDVQQSPEIQALFLQFYDTH
jgi:hypothetical protein